MTGGSGSKGEGEGEGATCTPSKTRQRVASGPSRRYRPDLNFEVFRWKVCENTAPALSKEHAHVLTARGRRLVAKPFQKMPTSCKSLYFRVMVFFFSFVACFRENVLFPQNKKRLPFLDLQYHKNSELHSSSSQQHKKIATTATTVTTCTLICPLIPFASFRVSMFLWLAFSCPPALQLLCDLHVRAPGAAAVQFSHIRPHPRY